MSLTEISFEQVQKDIAAKNAADFKSLTEVEKTLIKNFFKIEKFYQSEVKYCYCRKAKVHENKEALKLLKSFVKREIASYESSNYCWTIYNPLITAFLEN